MHIAITFRASLIWIGCLTFMASPLAIAQEVRDQRKPAAIDEDDANFDDVESAPQRPAKPQERIADKQVHKDPSPAKSPHSSSSSVTDAPSQEEQIETEPEDPTTLSLAMIRLDRDLPEGSHPGDILSEGKGTLHDMVRRLDAARSDDSIDAVVLEIRNPTLGRGKLHEVRTAIQRLRASGRKVYASLQSATPADYLVASACDQIVMPESGELMLPGIRAEVMFYHRLFQKLGIEADMLQVGDFKGAAEPYTREKMSEPFREQLTHVLDDLYEQMVEEIAVDRGLTRARVRELIDQGMLTANAAKAAGLIDIVAYEDDWQDSLMESHGHSELELIDQYAEKKVDTDFSGMSGLMRLMELLSGQSPHKRKPASQRVAVIYAIGGINTGKSGGSLFGESFMGCDTIVEALQTASDDDTVSAIVLRVDSPGGSALASDLIWNAIQHIDKPIVASMGDVAGSGGYYISMGCDRILAEPGTITGSIGVVGGKLVTGGMYQKFGLTTDVISRGKNSGLFSANERFTSSERQTWQAMMDDVYEQFTSKAAAGRKMDVDKLKKVAGGRIWTGRQAKEIGLVDEIGTLKDAIRVAWTMAGQDADVQPELLILPKSKSFFEQLFEGDSVSVPRVTASPLELRTIEEIKAIERLFAKPAVLIMPYQIHIR